MQSKKTLNVDLLNGPILKGLLLFMVPIFISNLFQQLYNAVDTALVGHVLGEDSLAAVGACTSIFELIVGFTLNLSSGFSIIIARYFGKNNQERMRQCIATSLIIGLGTCLFIMLLSFLGMKLLLHFIDTPEDILGQALDYINVISYFVIVTFAYNFCSAVLRAIGNSLIPLLFLVFSSVLNCFLDYAFMAWFHMGVAGAAIATVLSQAISAILCIIYIFTKVKMLVPHKEDFYFDKDLAWDLFSCSYAMGFMGSIVSVGSVILQSGINSLGKSIIAGHVAARKVFAILSLPYGAMATAIGTFVSQNMGADQGKRIIKGMKLSFVFDLIATMIVYLFVVIFAKQLIYLISGSQNEVILSNGSRYLMIASPFYFVLGVLIQIRYALQALGSRILPIVSSLIECVGKILFTIFLIPIFQYDAVIWCEPIIWCLMTIELLISYLHNPLIKKYKEEN